MERDLNNLIAVAESFVKQELQGNDSSHNYSHICRVRKLAKKLAIKENVSAQNQQMTDLSALLHDVDGWKYSKDDNGIDSFKTKKFLESQQLNPSTIDTVLNIIKFVGFKDSIGKTEGNAVSIEAKIVQDADRLDAMGAIGIARCFTFGGSRNRVLHNPAILPRTDLTKESYVGTSTTINHFYEKLLLLKDLMKTESGKKMAEQCHHFMESFLQEFEDEWDTRI